MDSGTDTETGIIDKKATRRERIVNRIWFGYNAFNFIATFGVYIFTLVIAVPVLQSCFVVGLVVMNVGTVLGLIQVLSKYFILFDLGTIFDEIVLYETLSPQYDQLVPEFLRNFIKLEAKTGSYVNHFFAFILAVCAIWLITSTVIVAKSQCDNINFAWITIYVNWGIFLFTAAIVVIVVVARILKARQKTRL